MESDLSRNGMASRYLLSARWIRSPGTAIGLLVSLGGLVWLVALGTGGCSNSEQTLKTSQMQKLDPALQRLVQGEARGMDRYSTSKRDDGTTVYSVILRSNEPEALREAGLPLNSVQGDIITARLTVAQIRKAARLDAVRKIENPSQARPTF